MSENKPYETKTYFAVALDPIHVGTGGYRLGRVDMSIVREPGTNVPKVPGSAISGACRMYAAMCANRYRWTQNGKTYVCAGQGQAKGKEGDADRTEGHCGKYDCPICTAFGFAKGDKGGLRGLAAFGDARVLFFPVNSMVGPVWVTCPLALQDVDGTEVALSNQDTFRLGTDFDGFQGGAGQGKRRLNFGWLMLEEGNEGDFTLDGLKGLATAPEFAPIKRRVVLVSNKLFGQIVNDNLEVRTSVSINPETGAAEEHMLFTYEALPRGTVCWFDVVYSEKRFFRVYDEETKEYKEPQYPPKPTVEKGLSLFAHLGVGGMGTRGMGRLRVVGLSTNG